MIKPINSNIESINQLAQVGDSIEAQANRTAALNTPAIAQMNAVGSTKATSHDYQVLITFKPNTTPFQQQAITTEMPTRNLQKFDTIPNLVTVTIRSNESPEAVLAQLRKNPQVETAEMD